jgi:hypothetical protein
MHPKADKLAQKSRQQVQHSQEAVQHGFQGPYSLVGAQKSSKGSNIYYWPYSTDLLSPYGPVLAQISRREQQLYSVCTVRIYTVRTTSLLHRNRGMLLCVISGKWHGFLGGRTAINTPRKLLLLLAQISR